MIQASHPPFYVTFTIVFLPPFNAALGLNDMSSSLSSQLSATFPFRIFILDPLLILTICIRDILDSPLAASASVDCRGVTGWEASGFGDGRLAGFLRGTMDGCAGRV